jgi:quinoprotein glucose dehydrogenase
MTQPTNCRSLVAALLGMTAVPVLLGMTALSAQAQTPVLDNDYVRVTRNAAPCAQSRVACGDRVIVALGDLTFRSATAQVTLERGDFVVFTKGETHEPPVGRYFEVAIKPNHPPATRPKELLPASKNVIRYDGTDFHVFDEHLAVGDTRERHSHNERVVIQLNRTRLRQRPDGEPEVIREILPDNAGFNQPVIHTAVNVGELPLRGIVIEFKPPADPSGDWPAHGNDLGGLKYSPLADINRDNVARLDTAFTWSTNERNIPASEGQKPARPGQFQATPLAIHDTLFFPTPYNRVIALDAKTGREFWSHDPQVWKVFGQPSNGTGFVHRGVATWTNGRERRVFINSRWRLIAIDASNGKPIASFGNSGEVDLTANLSRTVRKEHYTNTSPPVVWGDLVIVGNGVGDRLMYRGDPPGDVQAFDVKTGRRLWRFKTVPEPGEFGHDTWRNGSWKHMGHTNVWAPFTVDSARGLVYLPVGTPSNDWYGGERKGANLFAESIVCLDARTGRRVWHYQTVRHGLWDYDLPAPPNLLTVTHNGRRVDAVAVPTKQGFLFVFDRVTGRPLWPIEDRKVPASDVPGEQAWPTQPFPTKPAPYARQGFSADDVIDFTPELKAAALREITRYRLGPLYTPPSIEGTLVLPGVIGGSGWGGAAVDPESGWIYLKASNQAARFTIVKRDVKTDTIDAPYMVDLERSFISLATTEGGSLPIIKPPYGTLTAIDLNSGETKWTISLGDSPGVRNHPALRGVKLPPKLGVVGAPGSLVTKGGLLFTTGGGRVLYAIDSRTGATLWEYDLGQVGYANPMTYRTSDGRQYVAIATGAGTSGKLMVFSLKPE